MYAVLASVAVQLNAFRIAWSFVLAVPDRDTTKRPLDAIPTTRGGALNRPAGKSMFTELFPPFAVVAEIGTRP